MQYIHCLLNTCQKFYAGYKDHNLEMQRGFIAINTLLNLSHVFILSRQFSRWKGSLILLWNRRRRRRKRRNQERDKTSKEFYTLVEIIQMKSVFLIFLSFFKLLRGCPTTTFRSLPREQPHSPDINHCVLWFGFRPAGHWKLVKRLGP